LKKAKKALKKGKDLVETIILTTCPALVSVMFLWPILLIIFRMLAGCCCCCGSKEKDEEFERLTEMHEK